jgi:transcription antitermination protein NusB
LSKRRNARESALQILFQLEFEGETLEKIFERYWESHKTDSKERDYCRYLVQGVEEHREELDRKIQAQSKNWKIGRMDLIDRNILRLAAFELVYETGLAPAIIINEAVEIAKKFGGEASSTFINGVLDSIKKRIQSRSGNKREDHE